MEFCWVLLVLPPWGWEPLPEAEGWELRTGPGSESFSSDWSFSFLVPPIKIFRRQMKGLCRSPGLLEFQPRLLFIWSNKKTAPHPTWDKSCTPAIPPKLTFWKTSARFTRHHACPMDNGWVPVGIYLGRPVQAALESPFTQPRPVLIPPPRTLLWFAAPVTTLSHRFGCCFVVVVIIAAPPPLVNPYF